MLPVLIVDDDPTIRSLLQVICRRNGIPADVAGDGIEALEKMHATEYSVALIDLMMPRINGFELIEQLRASERHPTIFIVTAMTETYLADLDEGVAHNIIRKPFDVDEVGKLIAEAASHSS